MGKPRSAVRDTSSPAAHRPPPDVTQGVVAGAVATAAAVGAWASLTHFHGCKREPRSRAGEATLAFA